MKYTVHDLAKAIEARVEGNGSLEIVEWLLPNAQAPEI